MKKIFNNKERIMRAAALLAAAVLALSGCGARGEADASASAASDETMVYESSSVTVYVPPAYGEEEEVTEEVPKERGDANDEESAYDLAQEDKLLSERSSGYEYSDTTGYWYYSNYPHYKDFHADGSVKIALLAGTLDEWITLKSRTFGNLVKEAGYEYRLFDCKSYDKLWEENIQKIIDLDMDIVVIYQEKTSLVAGAVDRFREAGMAYMTTDISATDSTRFFHIPHVGTNDYAMQYDLGKLMAKQAKAENFMEGVDPDYGNFLLVIEDSPSVDSIHMRNRGFSDAMLEEFPDIPGDRVLWLDCGISQRKEILSKVKRMLKDRKSEVDKWLIVSSGGYGFDPTYRQLRKNGEKFPNVIMADVLNNKDAIELLRKEERIQGRWCAVGLSPVQSGMELADVVLKLAERRSAPPAFTPISYTMVTQDNLNDFYREIFLGYAWR